MVQIIGIGMGIGFARSKGVSFSLDAYLASLSDGFFFDFTKTDRHFQESTGPTLADDVGEAIGLAMDSRTWGGKTLAELVVAQPELLVGAWSLSVNGGTGAATESPTGTLNLTGDGTNPATADISFTTVAGGTYRLTYEISGNTMSNVVLGTSQGGSQISSNTGTGIGTSVFYFVATGTTTWLRFRKVGASLGVVSATSVKLTPGKPGTQATGTLKPLRQTTGAKFDGNDDNLLTSYTVGADDNFIVALVDVPASVSGVQNIAGSFNTSTSSGFLYGFDTDGLLRIRIGTGVTYKPGASDHRGQSVVVGISGNGPIARAFEADSLIDERAVTGALPTTVALRIGAHNNGGSASNFFGGSIKKIVAGRQFLDLETYRKIRKALLA